jgi:hypothetical protein
MLPRNGYPDFAAEMGADSARPGRLAGIWQIEVIMG